MNYYIAYWKTSFDRPVQHQIIPGTSAAVVKRAVQAAYSEAYAVTVGLLDTSYPPAG